MKKSLSGIMLILMVAIQIAEAQIDPTQEPLYVDPTDLRMVLRKKSSEEDQESALPEKGKLMLFVVPAIGSNPSLGAFYGVGGTAAIFLGEPATTSISSMSGSVLFTTKNQFVATVKGTIMTPDNDWEMLADFKYSFFSENTYGLGSDYSQPINESWNWGGVQTSGIGGAQPLTFNQLKIYYTALKSVAKFVYVGVGYHLDYHYKIKDEILDLDATEPVITSHYAYNKRYGFDSANYATSGTSLNIVYDSRDHTVNPYKGAFLQASFRTNSQFLGSQQNSKQLYLEARWYKSLSKQKPRHLISFWGIGQLITSGHVPYLHLPANAYDMRNRIGRGYVAGRFRGPSWVTAETEYRFPITKNGLFGGVVFASATTTSRDAITIGSETMPKLNLFEAVRPAGGFGARIMLNRTGRLNLAMDMAFGQHGAKGFYFAVGETF
ncbi:MAG TPA: BamA/TamA family outer membrane protein [Cyclobacteriaceae bacterium]|nr:BamA/TamA family outer membrane protein [Cyclobacteriaceae bacterium]